MEPAREELLTAACSGFMDEGLITSLLTKAYCAEEQRIVKQGSRDFFSSFMNHQIHTRGMLDKHFIVLLRASASDDVAVQEHARALATTAWLPDRRLTPLPHPVARAPGCVPKDR